MSLTTIYTQEHNLLIRRLRSARRDAGLTQKEVAKRLGVDQSTISALESGQRRISFALLTTLSKIYKTPFLVFITSKVSIIGLKELKRIAKRKNPKSYKAFMATLRGLFKFTDRV